MTSDDMPAELDGVPIPRFAKACGRTESGHVYIRDEVGDYHVHIDGVWHVGRVTGVWAVVPREGKR